ncbi:hypothetical protein [uncultured Rhodospira sp.]|uniref:hypothetical protein n=1 Tax=uncultured Rhodospira sp. TaxID=1936189 RepID=UPI00260BC582|nr:hypothetical protein [uncultured Rhodospira sp.]
MTTPLSRRLTRLEADMPDPTESTVLLVDTGIPRAPDDPPAHEGASTIVRMVVPAGRKRLRPA